MSWLLVLFFIFYAFAYNILISYLDEELLKPTVWGIGMHVFFSALAGLVGITIVYLLCMPWFYLFMISSAVLIFIAYNHHKQLGDGPDEF
jgi:vacuolar-type H+-ATPase subunit I/STV1